MAFASLEQKPLKLLNLLLTTRMSIGVLLTSVALTMMLIILLLMPCNLAGACFIGFGIDEPLGAFALRIAGGIFKRSLILEEILLEIN